MPASKPRKKKSSRPAGATRSGNPAVRAEEAQLKAAKERQEALGGFDVWPARPSPLMRLWQSLEQEQQRQAKADADAIIEELIGADRPVPELEDELSRVLGRTLIAHDAAVQARREAGQPGAVDSYSPEGLLGAIADDVRLAASGTHTAVDDTDRRDRVMRLLVPWRGSLRIQAPSR